jgi:hypothetical protein
MGIDMGTDADGPQLCLGPVAESYPPQCSGLPLDGWAWSEHDGTYDTAGDKVGDKAGGVRFATYLVTGTFDGTTMTYDSAVPGALYDPMPTTQPTSTATEQHTQAQLDTIAEQLRELPGFLTDSTGDNLVVVDVVHDDGSLQAWADQQYGAGLVAVRSALADLGRR